MVIKSFNGPTKIQYHDALARNLLTKKSSSFSAAKSEFELAEKRWKGQESLAGAGFDPTKTYTGSDPYKDSEQRKMFFAWYLDLELKLIIIHQRCQYQRLLGLGQKGPVTLLEMELDAASQRKDQRFPTP